MKTISRIDLADFGSPERIAQEIIKQVPDLPIPVPIDELARMLDITDITTLETQGFEGGLITDVSRSEGVILVNQASPIQRQRFTIGHELCHFLCPWHKPRNSNQFLCTFDDMRLASTINTGKADNMEVEANRFAAHILMPLPHFKKDLRLRKDVNIEHILDLATSYKTSKEATTRRYVEVRDEPCAAVISQNGRVLRFYKGSDFLPYLDVSSGNSVPRDSLTAKTNLTQAVVSDWEELDGSVWLSSPHGRRLPMIYEQVLPQSDGYRLTLLTLAEDIDELEEEEDLEESWTPRFKR